MACGLQMGIRVMVGMNNHTSSNLHEPDFECFQVFFFVFVLLGRRVMVGMNNHTSKLLAPDLKCFQDVVQLK